MEGFEFINLKMPVKFRACEGGYIATDGLRMCKVNYPQRLRLEKIMSDGEMERAKFVFECIWRDQNGEGC